MMHQAQACDFSDGVPFIEGPKHNVIIYNYIKYLILVLSCYIHKIKKGNVTPLFLLK
jgi:hypothetical protein